MQRKRVIAGCQAGFTLVELAIVIVIIGLLVGGVLVGQDLIRVATNMSQINQIQQYEEAYVTFRVRYNCIAGDCDKAAGYFPGLANGDGDGAIENNLNTFYDASGSITWTASTEYHNFFPELSQAGLIPGTFDTSAVIGKGMPALKYKPTSSFFMSDTQSFQVLNPGVSRNPDITALRHGTNALWFVACNVTGDSPWLWDDDCGIFIPIDLQAMDEKLDDGLPLSGKFFGFGGANSHNNCLAGSAYDISQTTRQCQAAYIID